MQLLFIVLLEMVKSTKQSGLLCEDFCIQGKTKSCVYAIGEYSITQIIKNSIFRMRHFLKNKEIFLTRLKPENMTFKKSKKSQWLSMDESHGGVISIVISLSFDLKTKDSKSLIIIQLDLGSISLTLAKVIALFLNQDISSCILPYGLYW